MRRIAITLVALAGAAAAFAAPAAAYEIDPLTGQPVQSSYGQQPYVDLYSRTRVGTRVVVQR